MSRATRHTVRPGGQKRIFLAWKPFCTRSHNQAKHFGATEIYIWPFPSRRSKARLLGRYAVSLFQTLRILWRENADVVFALNQPPFLILAVFVYTKLSRSGGYVLDSHSAAFNDPKWAWFRPFYRIIARNAMVNINTNRHHQMLVEKWGGKSFIVSDVPIDHEQTYVARRLPRDSVLVVASFMFDEPLEEIWAAAVRVPEVTFYVSGDSAKAPPELHDTKPENVTFTGFLSKEDYFNLMVSVDAVMVLTTRDNTMQMGAYEALSLERPIITSNWGILRDSFGRGAVFVDNSAESIAEGVREIISGNSGYRDAAKEQKIERRRYFDRVRAEIDNVLCGDVAG